MLKPHVEAYLQSTKTNVYTQDRNVMENDCVDLEGKRQRMCEELLLKVEALRSSTSDRLDWTLDIVGSYQ
jgi:hypothetical protein